MTPSFPSYTKPYLSPGKQLQLLKSRGLEVSDDRAAIECLKRNGYYRLSGYWYPFREIVGPVRTDTFLPGSRFEDAQALYVFDKELKLLLMDAIERVEIASRAAIALRLGAKNRFAHHEAPLLDGRFVSAPRGQKSKHEKWLERLEDRVNLAKDEFILHYHAKYGARWPLPIWIAIEVWDFGLLSHFYTGMKGTDRKHVAMVFNVPNAYIFGTWLRSLNYVRNVIAHHSRLWNTGLVEIPSLPSQNDIPEFAPLLALPGVNRKIYSICCILAHLSHVINPQTHWNHRLFERLKKFPIMPHANLSNMGFPSDWETHSFWK